MESSDHSSEANESQEGEKASEGTRGASMWCRGWDTTSIVAARLMNTWARKGGETNKSAALRMDPVSEQRNTHAHSRYGGQERC